MRTKERIGFTTTIDILRGTMSADVAANRYDLLKTFGVGHDVPARDWRDYLLQMLQMGFIEIAYTEDKHLKVRCWDVRHCLATKSGACDD